MSFHQITVAGFAAVALRSADLEVVVIPTIGMKLSNLRRRNGREWLWRSDQIPLALPRPGASYVETADSGGWDECFPTVGPSPVPNAPPNTPSLPDHGELWSAVWTSSVFEHREGTTLTGLANGVAFPYEFHRRITLDNASPVLKLHYLLRHTGDAAFPWIWSSHPLLNVQPGSILSLPDVTQVKVDAVHGRHDLTVDDIVSWPAGIGGAAENFTFPDPAGWAAKLFGDLGPSGRMLLTDPRRGERLEFTVRSEEVPQVGLWINCGGWAPPGRTPYYNFALEPCIGAPDRLDRAALAWGTAQVLSPGEERRWSLEVRLLNEND
jgi:galactose mutarotase-like enzyme